MEYKNLSRVIVYGQEVLQVKRPNKSYVQSALAKTSPNIYRSNQFEYTLSQPFS